MASGLGPSPRLNSSSFGQVAASDRVNSDNDQPHGSLCLPPSNSSLPSSTRQGLTTRLSSGADDPTGGGGKPACIHGADLAQTPHGSKPIAQLERGDLVLVGRGRYEPITGFLHRHFILGARGYRFTTENGTTVTLSDEHLVFVAPGKRAMLAKNVRVGQKLYLWPADGGIEEESIIVRKERAELEGRFSPLTPSGVLLVNNVLVSCYSQIEDHHLMHRVVNWLLPFTSLGSSGDHSEDGGLDRGESLHWLGHSLWYHLRHWFVAGASAGGRF